MSFGIALDLGTSGLRAQAIDLQSGSTLSTAITTRHPLAGLNLIDHVQLALEIGVPHANAMVMNAISGVIDALDVDLSRVHRLAVCGNPVQLALLRGLDVTDFAFAGSARAHPAPPRGGAVLFAREFHGWNLPNTCEVIIPPSVLHEVGADALAMIVKSGMLNRDETAIVTDLGTNAEVALVHDGTVWCGSTAAGPALEGQHISAGMLAAPGALSDVAVSEEGLHVVTLDANMIPVVGSSVCLSSPATLDHSAQPIGITGTGTIALLAQALEQGLVTLPHIATADRRLHVGALSFSEADMLEAGKAIGAVRAGHLSLCHAAGIDMDDIDVMYMAGASGTYVDAAKAQRLGLVPPRVRKVLHLGNTSLAMARDLVVEPTHLDAMGVLAERLRRTHCMFATSNTFKRAYILEFSRWTEGMPMKLYREMLGRYGFPRLSEPWPIREIVHVATRDVDELGELGLHVLEDVGAKVGMELPDCSGCSACVDVCPGDALVLTSSAPLTLWLDASRCHGTGCRLCEGACEDGVLCWLALLTGSASKA